MSAATPGDGTPVVVTTAHGALRGHWEHGVARFAGVPFAAPPVGDLRFRPPAPVTPWEGERSAETFAPICPQNPSMMDAVFGGDSEPWDEDCLYLNVWTRVPEPDGQLPVMVWIHGGGFEMGSGSSPIYHGTQYAQDGVVLVTINYRLGALGFLELGHLDPAYAGSGNVGLLDQVAALEWVRENIAAFGGDPSNITVFGQSAGAMSISLLMASPRASGLFSRAITQSGATNAARSAELARRDTDDYLEAGGFTSVVDLVSAPPESLLAAHAALSSARVADPEEFIRRAGSPLGFLSFRPVADGELVPVDPLAAIAAGAARGVRLLTGSTSEEWKLFSLMVAGPATEDDLRRRVGLLLSGPDEALEAYNEEYGEGSFADIDGAVLTDMVFRIPMVRMADAHATHTPTYQYLWDWKSQAWGGMIGAAHAIDVPFVFNLIEDHRLHIFLGADAPRELARATQEAWRTFAVSGEPEATGLPAWPALGSTGGRPVMVLDTVPHIVDDPNPTTRRFWDTPAATMPTASG